MVKSLRYSSCSFVLDGSMDDYLLLVVRFSATPYLRADVVHRLGTTTKNTTGFQIDFSNLLMSPSRSFKMRGDGNHDDRHDDDDVDDEQV
jgi:hypothetical protein